MFRLMAVSTIWLVFISAASAQPTNDKGLSELKAAAPQDSAAITARAEKLASLDEAALASELKSLQVLHERNREHWKIIEAARRNDVAAIQAVEARSAKYTLNLWQNQAAYDRKLARLKHREEEEFNAKFHESYSKNSSKINEWNESAEGKAIQAAREQAGRVHRDTIKTLTDEAARGNSATDKELDDLQRKVLDDFQVTANAVNKAQQMLDEKTKPKVPPTPTDTTPPESATPAKTTSPSSPPTMNFKEHYSLNFDIQREPEPPRVVDTDELFELTIVVSNGKPPFQIVVNSSEGGVKTVTMAGLGTRTFPFAFKTGNQMHRIKFEAIDSNGVSSSDEHNLFVKKPRIGSKKDPADNANPGTNSGPSQPTIPSSPAPLLQPITGMYRAKLWCLTMIESPPGVGGYDGILPPVPVTINFDPSGSFTGKCDYTAPHTLFGPEHRANYPSYEWKAQFTFSGNVDWQTGIMTLSLPKIEVTSFYQKDDFRTEHRIVTSGQLQARHTSDPYFDKFLLQMGLVAPHPMAKALDKHEEIGHPNVELGSHGKYLFADSGWYGAPGDHPGLIPPSGKLHSKEMKLTVGDVVMASDLTADYQRVLNSDIERKSCSWYLKLGDREVTAADLNQMDLVATTISPDGHIEASRNEQVYVQFTGVFSNDYSKVLDLTNACEWEVPPGLTQVRPGVFQSAKPGKYAVRARTKGKSSNWMEGFVTIEIK